MDSFANEIENHYDRFDEDNRLKSAFGELEEARTKEMLSRFIPGKGKTVIDVGGATGVYSFFLAAEGHNVRLVDIVPKHIKLAKSRAVSDTTIASPESFTVADGRDLPFEGGIADAVLIHGPLYHLVKREDRIRVLREAYRVLKPEGILIAVTISRFAGLNYGIDEGHVFDDEYFAMVTREVKTGVRNDAPDMLNTFTEAYFHLSSEAFEEVSESGFKDIQNYGVTGLGWMSPDFEVSWKDPKKRKRVMEIARLSEKEPTLDSRTLTVATK